MSQRLTPVDILNLRFGRRMSGYAIAEVDEFVRRVATDMEAVLTECAAQRERLQSLERELAQYHEIEATLRDALILAQKAADETRISARQQADLLLHEAQSRVREMDAQSHRRQAEAELRIERLLEERRRLARDLRARLTTQLAWLDEEMEPPATYSEPPKPLAIVNSEPQVQSSPADFTPDAQHPEESPTIETMETR